VTDSASLAGILNLDEVRLYLDEEDRMLVQLLLALVGEVVFGAIKSRHRGFQAEMERYLEAGAVPPGKSPAPPPR